jgi:hypothetical protein
MKEDQLREDQRREALARKELEPHGEETLPPPAAVRVEEPAPQAETVRAAEPAPRFEPAPQPAPRAPEARVEQPKLDPKVLLESAGLVMIETDRSKAPAQPQAEEPQHLGRPRRERPKPQAQDDELKQVETRK